MANVGRQPYLWRIGKRYGRLVVKGYAGRGKWSCLCDCGAERIVWVSSLTSGNSQSCGCYKRDLHTKHGLSDTGEKNVHTMMLQRCYNPNHDSFPHYGGRGISVCDRWRGENGLVNFVADMGRRPTAKHRLDRIDNDGPYSPENCRWATEAVQQRNTSRNVNLTWLGRTMCLKDWAKELNVSATTLTYRVSNWPLERAMTASVRRTKPAAFVDHMAADRT